MLRAEGTACRCACAWNVSLLWSDVFCCVRLQCRSGASPTWHVRSVASSCNVHAGAG